MNAIPSIRKAVGKRLAVMGLFVFACAYSVNVAAAQAPANDAFASRIALTGNPTPQTLGFNVVATKEVGEPNHAGNAGGASVWYTYTAPIAGTARVSFNSTGFTALVNVYTGAAVNALVSVGASTSTAGRVSFPTAAGVVYQIAIDGVGGARGDFQLAADVLAPPANDNLASAIDLTNVATFAVLGNNIGGTTEVGENQIADGNSIWYKWTAPTTRNVVLNSIGSGAITGTVLGVYSGPAVPTIATLTFIGSDTSEITFPAVAGTIYYFQLDNNDTPGSLAMNLPVKPGNDDFANATDLGAVATFNATGSTIGASVETGEPGTPFASIWYKWTAPVGVAGKVRINTFGSVNQTNVQVYTGTALANLVALGGNNNSSQFSTVAGTVYHFQVDSFNGISNIGLNLVPAPANDDFSKAIDLGSALNFLVQANNLGATNETTTVPLVVEPFPGTGATIWYKWTSTTARSITMTTDGSLVSTPIRVFTGATVGALTTIATSNTSVTFTATAGTVYFIALDGSNSSDLGYIQFNLTTPANDAFASAFAIGANDTLFGNNLNATSETGEPDHGNTVAVASLWYTYTAATASNVKVSLNNEGAQHKIGVYTGATVNALTLIDQDTIGFGNSLTFKAVAGTTYRIAIDGNAGQFSISVNTTPVNDNFVDSIALTGATFTVSGDGSLATVEPLEINVSQSDRTLWYNWTAPATATVVFGSTNNALIDVFTGGAIDALSQISSGAGKTNFKAVAGTKYQIRISIFGPFLFGTVPTPANDDFANAQLITGATFDVIGSNFGATKEAGEQSVFVDSVWYKWTAPAASRVTLSFTAEGPSEIALLTGTKVNALTFVTLDPLDRNNLTFAAVAGTTYYIAVGDGQGTFQITLKSGPPNDNFANAIPLTGNPALATGHNFAATKEAGEPDHNFVTGGQSVWYTWTAPAAGATQLSLSNNSAFYQVTIYTGTALNALTRVGGAGNSLTQFTAVAGTVYIIAIDSNATDSFKFVISQAPPNDNFVNAIALTGLLPIETVGSNLLATVEPGEPNHGGQSGTHSIWYSYTPTVNHRLEVSTIGSTFDTSVGVYTGALVSALTIVAGNDNLSALDEVSVAQFDAIAGTKYYIAVSGSSQGGRVELSVSNANIAKTSPLTVTPVPAVQSEPVVFTIGTDASEFFLWEFGDGTTQVTTVGTTTHVYATGGTFTAKVTASVLNGQSITESVQVIVFFQKDFDTTKATITLNFGSKKPGTDVVSVSGLLALGSLSTSGEMTINFGAKKEFSVKKTLTAGKFKSTTESITIQPAKEGNSKFTAAFKGNFIKTFEPLGLTTAIVKAKPITIPVQILFNGTSFDFNLNLYYTSTGKKGTAK